MDVSFFYVPFCDAPFTYQDQRVWDTEWNKTREAFLFRLFSLCGNAKDTPPCAPLRKLENSSLGK